MCVCAAGMTLALFVSNYALDGDGSSGLRREGGERVGGLEGLARGTGRGKGRVISPPARPPGRSVRCDVGETLFKRFSRGAVCTSN